MDKKAGFCRTEYQNDNPVRACKRMKEITILICHRNSMTTDLFHDPEIRRHGNRRVEDWWNIFVVFTLVMNCTETLQLEERKWKVIFQRR